MNITRRSFVKKSSYSAAAVSMLGIGVGLAEETSSSVPCPPEELAGAGVRSEEATRIYTKWRKIQGAESKWLYGAPTNSGTTGDVRTAPVIGDPPNATIGFPPDETIGPCYYVPDGPSEAKVDGNASVWSVVGIPPQGASNLPLGPTWEPAPVQSQSFQIVRTVPWIDSQKYVGSLIIS